MIIACNPENIASDKTCQNLGAEFIETMELPVNCKSRKVYGEQYHKIYRINLLGGVDNGSCSIFE